MPPNHIILKNAFPTKRDEWVRFHSLLRSVPGTREVYDAVWDDRAVIIKIFYNRAHAKRHIRREWNGLINLINRDLCEVKPLCYGKTEHGHWAVVVEKIVDSKPADKVFDMLNETADKYDLLSRVCKKIALYHDKGVSQLDMHLGNFLLKGDRVYMLDPGQMAFYSQPVSRKTGLAQVAMLAGYLSDDDEEDILRLSYDYLMNRGFRPVDSDRNLILSFRIRFRKTAIRKGLNKTLRTSKRYMRIENKNYHVVYEKKFFKDTDIESLIRQIDTLMDNGQILKNGNTCYVSRINWEGKPIVIKRYNNKGMVHSIRQTLKKSRARRSWLNGHQLKMIGINTPNPVCAVQFYKNKLVQKAYLITEYMAGQTLYAVLKGKDLSEDQRKSILRQLNMMLQRLGRYQIVHGDLKHNNIIISDQGLILTDLDGMKTYRSRFLFQRHDMKDLHRLNIPGLKDESG